MSQFLSSNVFFFFSFFVYSNATINYTFSDVLKRCRKRLTKCQGAIEFLRLCLNFGVTPTFAQVERIKARTWKKSSENYQKNVMEEELRTKLCQLKCLKDEVQNAYKDLREECSFLRFVAITGMLNTLRNTTRC